MPLFATTWPWISLGAAGILLILLIASDGLAADHRQSRWHDMAWLTLLGLAAVLLHQFEESGIDLHGRPYALMGALCTGLGYRDAVACPVPLSLITVFNVGTVWIAGLIAVLAAPRRPLIGFSFFAIPLGSFILHGAAAIALRRYDPGLFTGAVLFLPLVVYACIIAIRRYEAGISAVAAMAIAGMLIATILIGLLAGAVNLMIADGVLAVVLVLLAFLPAGMMLAATRRGAPPEPAARQRPPRPRARRAGSIEGRHG